MSFELKSKGHKKVLLRENGRGVPPAPYPVLDISARGGGQGGGYYILVLAGEKGRGAMGVPCPGPGGGGGVGWGNPPSHVDGQTE